jgi:hypothetical protein
LKHVTYITAQAGSTCGGQAQHLLHACVPLTTSTLPYCACTTHACTACTENRAPANMPAHTTHAAATKMQEPHTTAPTELCPPPLSAHKLDAAHTHASNFHSPPLSTPRLCAENPASSVLLLSAGPDVTSFSRSAADHSCAKHPSAHRHRQACAPRHSQALVLQQALRHLKNCVEANAAPHHLPKHSTLQHQAIPHPVLTHHTPSLLSTRTGWMPLVSSTPGQVQTKACRHQAQRCVPHNQPAEAKALTLPQQPIRMLPQSPMCTLLPCTPPNTGDTPPGGL